MTRSLSTLNLNVALRAGALAAVVLLSGCGRPSADFEQVQGTVTFEGRPVPKASVLFQNAGAGLYLTAAVGTDGKYRVATMNGEGLPAGTYQVAVSPPEVILEPGKPVPPPQPFPQVPEKYRLPETSGLTLTVKPGENLFNIDMRP